MSARPGHLSRPPPLVVDLLASADSRPRGRRSYLLVSGSGQKERTFLERPTRRPHVLVDAAGGPGSATWTVTARTTSGHCDRRPRPAACVSWTAGQRNGRFELLPG